MRAWQWLKRLRRNERGNVLIIGAASMPLLIGSAALGVDAIQLTLWKRQLQRAADSGAIAGAYAFGQGASQGQAVANDLDEHIDSDLEENEHPVLTDVSVSTGSYAQGSISSDSCATRGVDPCFNRAVGVALTAQRTLPFMSIFTGSATEIRAEAAAALVDEGEYCLISLYDGTDPGITAGGNANLTLGCGMATNSRAESAVTASGSSAVTSTPIAAVGGLDGDGQNFVGDTVLRPHSAVLRDPLSWVPTPPTPTGCVDPPAMGPQYSGTIGNDSGVTCYNYLDAKGTVTMKPGIYYINGGDVTFNSQSVINGEHVVIILTGPNGDAGDMHVNGQATLNLSAPSTGPYHGVVLYRDRRAPVTSVRFNGGATLNLVGALYFPTTDIETMGNFELSSQCIQVVGRKIDFKGTADITNECPDDSGASAFAINVVRLVG